MQRVMGILYKFLPFFLGGYTESGVRVGGLLQLARFLALAATLSILIGALNKMTDVINWFKLLLPNATVVYGTSSCANCVLESLNRRIRIRGEGKFIKNASRYVLMFPSDAENLEFYNRYYEWLKDKNVYMMLENISRQNIENPRITVFSIAENCARQYWRSHPVLRNERIAIIGFENVGQNILLYGLQVNLIDPEQHFEYHIYGDGTAFRREHTELDQMKPDEIVFHDDGLYSYAELSAFDRVILCGSRDENCNIEAVSKLLVSAPNSLQIHIYAPNGDIITNLFGSSRLVCFGAAEETASADMIFNERSMEAARRQHEFYFKKYGGTPWEKLDAFKRYSNVSSSDYMFVIDRLLRQGISEEKAAELEHIRWCRYHYIHNWKYAPETDAARRLHNCLLPFSQLSEAEKLKDVEAIRSKREEQGQTDDSGGGRSLP